MHDRRPLEPADWTSLVLFAAAALAAAAVVRVGWSHAISDWYGWRQTQTAISAYFMTQGGPWLDYQFPVFGPPWQVPHEFPLYQVLVVTLTRVSGLALEPAGRSVSLAFFGGALAAGYGLLGACSVTRPRRLLVLALWLVSPLYLFWSRAFMIESTALCLCLVFLLFAGRFVSGGGGTNAALAVLAGSLGGAVKPPTVVVPAALAALWWLLALRRARSRPGATTPSPRPHALRRVAEGLTIALPLLAAWGWQQHAEAFKHANPFASGISSNRLLRDWVVDPAARLEPDSLRPLGDDGIPFSIGHPAVLAAAVGAIAIAGRRRALFAAALGGFLLHFVVFMPLDDAFHYYWYGAGVYLVGAVGIAAVALLERGGARRHLAWPLVLLCAVGSAHTYAARLLPLQRHDAYRKPDWTIRLARAVNAATSPDDVVIGFGMDWNPEVPYYARRRALMWPYWSDAEPGSPQVDRMMAALGDEPVGALFDCHRRAPRETIARLRERFGLVESATFQARCALYVRPAAAGVAAAPGAER